MAACRGPTWGALWSQLHVPVFEFADLGLRDDAPDPQVWAACQARGLILVTGNRNRAGPDSLEAVIRSHGTVDSLPVFTLASPDRVRHDRIYAEAVAARLIELLLDVEDTRGAGRVYLP